MELCVACLVCELCMHVCLLCVVNFSGDRIERRAEEGEVFEYQEEEDYLKNA
jgi:hypothetical protein